MNAGAEARRDDWVNDIRRAREDDIEDIVAIHRQAFGDSFLTRLGKGFLRRYYRLVLRCGEGIVLVCRSSEGLAGFACGFVDPDSFYERMNRKCLFFAGPIICALVRQPRLIAKVAQSFRRIRRVKGGSTRSECELSSIAVSPQAVGRGVGKSLIHAFLGNAGAMGVNYVYLTTEAHDNEAANEFYRKLGFRLRRRFERQKGRLMNEYGIHLETTA